MDISDKVEGAPPSAAPRVGDHICTACRTEMKLDVANHFFCPKCGYRPMAAAPSANTQEDGKKEKAPPRWLIWVKIGGYIAIGAACIYMLYAMTTMMDFSL